MMKADLELETISRLFSRQISSLPVDRKIKIQGVRVL